ncbi:MAG: nuclear transport factor 2 family protein [Actinomycetota bacterium]|nr:nuclear transport factor 2 family protein [Actinomycetota bacterium]
MTSDLNELRDQYHRSVAAFIQGDPDVQKPLWSRRDDVTLANPLGPPVKGFDAICEAADRAAEQISDGEGYTFDTVSWVETADLAYEVGLQRNRAKLAGATEKVPISLRVTTVFRREDDGWKVVHRHADPITEARSVQSVMQRSGDAS